MNENNVHLELQKKILYTCNAIVMIVALVLVIFAAINNQFDRTILGILGMVILGSSTFLLSVGQYTSASYVTCLGLTFCFYGLFVSVIPTDVHRIYMFPTFQSISLMIAGLLAQKRRFTFVISGLTLLMLIHFIYTAQLKLIEDSSPITIVASIACVVLMAVLSDQIFLFTTNIFNRFMKESDKNIQYSKDISQIVNTYNLNKKQGVTLETISLDQATQITDLQNLNSTIIEDLARFQNILNDFITTQNSQSVATQNIEKIFAKHQQNMHQYKNIIERISADSQTLEQNTKENQNNSSELLGLTEQGQHHMTQSIGAIKKVAENSKNILDMISLIMEVAERTNVLALNAAVEASRAGKAGDGFAIVAKEIKKLSTETSQNADIINKNLNHNMHSIEEASNVVKNAANTLEKIYQIVIKFTNNFEENGKFTESISENSFQISLSTTNMNTIINEIHQIVDNSLTVIEQGVNQSAELQHIVDKLSSNITLLRNNSNIIREYGHKTKQAYINYTDTIKLVETTIQKLS